MTFDIEIRYETRYRMFCNSIWNALKLSLKSKSRNIDIEGRNIRYRSSTISKNTRYRSIKDQHRLITISKKRRYRSAKLRYWYIPISNIFSISIYAISISMYDVEALRFDIECCLLRYLCFFAWVDVARARFWTHIAV